VEKSDLKICQEEGCQEPATYGDGLTWSLCSQHNYEKNKTVEEASVEKITIEASEPNPLPSEGFPHETKEGLTSIIIPIYNTNYPNFHMTGNCIGSIHEHTKLPYEIILVDNGSPIQTGKMEDYNVDKVIRNEENLGYVKAVNKGIRAAFGEYIAVVTSDTQVYDNWLEDAQEALKHIELVIATPMYGEPYSRAREANKKRDAFVGVPIEQTFDDFRDGACLITTKEIFNMVGLFDEHYFNYASDSDLYRRIEAIGGIVKSCKKINIHHIIGATGSGISENPDIMTQDKETYKRLWEDGQDLP